MENQSFVVNNFKVLERLVKTIGSKKNIDPSVSYVSKLLNSKNDLVLKKIGEEATELILAAKGGTKAELISESADLFFHLLGKKPTSKAPTLDAFGLRYENPFQSSLITLAF